MESLLITIQVVVAILLTLAVLTQNKGGGFSAAIGGGGASNFVPSKRGAEKVLFNATIVLAIIFVANSIAFFFI
ncbi:preprotein translocase subunit SecG [Candidatus Peregrinibacteria bacterium HGW-Peregrinibacteria-1]|jgi:preprotein translocase subunit SecG|nr:MAG: preprotein translocase subunit SecG [Candidatus Peregrinibacteria bacterium HGW-Peregrinibacteria-1]